MIVDRSVKQVHVESIYHVHVEYIYIGKTDGQVKQVIMCSSKGIRLSSKHGGY